MLRLKQLTKTYKTGDQALKQIDLEVPDGQVLALIGPSGAGKSTMIRCINRLVEPSSGEVWLDDAELSNMPMSALRHERRRMGVIFQEYALVERLTVMENVLPGRLGYVGFWRSFMRRYPQDDVDEAFRLLDRVGLLSMADKRADELSGGQRQRVGICRALIQNPKLLLVDEPTAFPAARNTTPSKLFIRPIAFLVIVSTRSINSLIWALLLIAIIGPGVFAGVIAIAIRSVGFCAKLLYEAFEEIDETQVEAITATGASRWQVMAYGIVPQILPAFAGIAVFR